MIGYHHLKVVSQITLSKLDQQIDTQTHTHTHRENYIDIAIGCEAKENTTHA